MILSSQMDNCEDICKSDLCGLRFMQTRWSERGLMDWAFLPFEICWRGVEIFWVEHLVAVDRHIFNGLSKFQFEITLSQLLIGSK